MNNNENEKQSSCEVVPENTSRIEENSNSSASKGLSVLTIFRYCFCALLITATVAVIPGLYNQLKNFIDASGKPVETIKKIIGDISDVASRTSDYTKTFVTGERQGTGSIILPPKEMNPEDIKPDIATVSTSMESVEIAVKEEKKQLVDQFFVDKNKQGQFSRNFLRETDKIIKNRKAEVKCIFDEAKSRVPDFVEAHYEDRDSGPTMVKLMNEELLSDETLDDFLANTALEIDELFYDAVDKELENALLSIDLGTDTLTELKKRLPSARQICNQMYIDVMNRVDSRSKEPLYTKRANDLRDKYDSLCQNYPTLTNIGKVGFVAILGFLCPPSLFITVPALLTDVVQQVRLNNVKNSFKRDLISQFDKQCRIYQKNLEISIKDIAKCYVDLLINAKIKSLESNSEAYNIEFPNQK